METWRTIPTNPEYEASDLGRVRRAETGRVLTPFLGTKGYFDVGLREGGATRRRLIHRLVCAAFHGPPPTPKHQAAHWDCDKMNNHPDNLRWATQSENWADTLRLGRGNFLRGSDSPNAKLTEEDVREIRWAKRRKGIMDELAAKFGVTSNYIGCLRNRGFKVGGRPIWPHVPFPD